MTACSVCGREFGAEVVICPYDGQPLAGVAAAVADEDPETVVRPRRAQPIGSPRFTEVQIKAPVEPAAGEVRATDTPDRVYTPRPVWPFVLAISAVVVVAVAIVAYLVISRQTDLSSEVGSQISEARVAVADARARLESLPVDSPLRSRLLQLQQWDRELQNFELEPYRDRSMASRAREIQGLARSIGDDARAAGAAVPSSPPQVLPAAPPAPPPDTAGTTAPEVDPMAGKPADTNTQAPAPETKPGGEAGKPGGTAPAEPATPGTKPPEGEAPKPKPAEPAPPPAGAAPKTEPKPAPPQPTPGKPV